MWLVVWGIAWRQIWALRATCPGQPPLYTDLWKLHNRHVFCKSPLHPRAASSRLLSYVANRIAHLSTSFVPAGTSTARLLVATEAVMRSRLTTEIAHFIWYGSRRKAYKLHFIGINCSSAWRCNPLTSNDTYSGCTAPLTSKHCILYIYSTNIGTEHFKHGIHSPFFSLQNAVCFIILTYLVPVLFTFYI